MHCKSNYPAKKSESDLDVELKDNLEGNIVSFTNIR